MVNRSMEEIMQEVDFLLDELDEICRYGFHTYRSYDPAVLIEHDPRASAACIYAHIAAEADRRFSGHERIALVDHRPLGGLRVWRVDDVVLIRFKKQDEDGRSRNYPTKQAREYDAGSTLPGLPPPAVRLSVGYWLDPTNTEFRRTQVSRPLGQAIDWCVAIVPVADRAEDNQRWVDVTREPPLKREQHAAV